ncbi:DEAD/DEAH box helicase [Candidatus Woesearchaeota archaeon]|nr:DEAD/DEAH box helicase [Candidatus Woesearchaeota archaeon]
MLKLKGIEPRIYQERIFGTAIEKNTLVVLPTGLGKTAIAIMLMIHRLNQYPAMKALMIAPTKPLCQQHYNTIKKHIDGIREEEIKLFTGSLRPEKRKKEWENARIIIATPQTIESSLLSGDINLRDVCLLVIDEAHRAVGNYSYVGIATNYMKTSKRPRILALTASPGSDLEKVREVIDNLYIDAVEVRTEEDPDVKPYVHSIKIKWIEIELPHEIKQLQETLKNMIKERIKELKEKDVRISSRPSKKDLLELQASLSRKLGEEFSYSTAWLASMIAEIIKLNYALELLESQGVSPFYKYLKKLILESEHKKTKASKSIVESVDFKKLLLLAEELLRKGIRHPKLDRLVEVLRDIKENEKVIIFTQYRDTAVMIEQRLKDERITSKIFVGQQKKGLTGMSQKEQKRIIEEFSKGEFQCLISTSIGEEGLDIPEVEVVIFYEPIPSIIRHIQRRGRTGRHKEGRVIVLYTKNSIDAAYRWSLYHKKREMFKAIRRLGREIIKEEEKKIMPLTKFITGEKEKREEPLEIIVDYREKNSPVVKHLVKENISLRLANLPVGDFMIGPVVIELKNVPDFVASIIDKRLIDQASRLAKTEKPLIIIQGEEDPYNQRNIHPNAINGMLASIVVDYEIPIVWMRNPKETARFLVAIAKRFQGEKRNINPHIRKPATLKEQQEYLIASIPGIGPMLARNLLRRFRSIKAIANASLREIEKVEGIGKKKAETIKKILEEEWREEE